MRCFHCWAKHFASLWKWLEEELGTQKLASFPSYISWFNNNINK